MSNFIKITTFSVDNSTHIYIKQKIPKNVNIFKNKLYTTSIKYKVNINTLPYTIKNGVIYIFPRTFNFFKSCFSKPL